MYVLLEHEKTEMRDLKKIFWAHDNNTSDKWENYIDIYDKQFIEFVKKNEPINLLEIGVQNGGSLEIWEKFFPENSTFIGLDINPKCAKLDLGDNVRVFCCNAADDNALNKLLGNLEFDIIIDDGSHTSSDIITTFKSCFSRVKPSGFYVIEDLHCSYDPNYEGGFHAKDSAQEFFKNLTDSLNYRYIHKEDIEKLDNAELFHTYHQRIESITFYDSIVVIKFSKLFEDHIYKRFLTGHHQPIHDNLSELVAAAKDGKHPLVLSHSLISNVDPASRNKIAIEPSLLDTLRDDNSYLYKFTKLHQSSLQNDQPELLPISFQENKMTENRKKSKFERFCKKWKKSIKKRLYYIGLGPKPDKQLNDKILIEQKDHFIPRIELPVKKNFDANVASAVERFNYKSDYKFIKEGKIKFTILVTTYNTPAYLLERLLQTILLQSYQNFEIVIVDDFSKTPDVREVLTRFSNLDTRIKVIYNKENLGISGASNIGLKSATGDYIALVDHDDELTWDALQSVADCIRNHPDADLIYSDECIIDENGFPTHIYAKPDWSPLLLSNSMYIGHLTVYRNSIMKKIGGFRSRFDFSQDYDLALRVTETTDKIYHISKPLYGWRAIATSAASGGKDFARATNIFALQSALDRRKWKGKAVPLSFANRIIWDELGDWPLVSIIIPSDSIDNIRETLDSIINKTIYNNYELLVVTNSNIIKTLHDEFKNVNFVPYDKSFNFSDKCNQGAKVAKGKFVVFFNDDVRIIDEDWLEKLVEIAEIDGVGAVAPKMLYSNGTIQHAGMVTGVRRLVGTAFHAIPETQESYFNMANQLREVSLLCGACLLVSSKTFKQVGGFDIENTPIAHSDVDLCFKIRSLGQTCIYQPDAKLIHLGHLSIQETEKTSVPKIDKSDIYLLKRWPEQVAIDPYFSPLMRSLLYHDSPEDFTIYPGREFNKKSKGDVLLISHDLTNSGAPRVVVEIAKTLEEAGYFVVIACPEDGPLRKELQSLGFNVIIDSLLLKMHDSVLSFARNFDLVIANTVITWPIVKQLDSVVPVLWYIHEVELVSELADSIADCAKILHDAKNIIAVSDYASNHIKKYRDDKIIRLETGFPQLERKNHPGDDLLISTFGTFEYRKGQDILLAAMEYISQKTLEKFKLRFFGRTLAPEFKEKLEIDAKKYKNVAVKDELSHEDCILETELSDLVIVPSRSDTLPIVSIDALGAGVPIMCTKETGTSRYIENNKSGFIIAETTPKGIAKAIEDALEITDQWSAIGAKGRLVFEKHFSSSVFQKRLLEIVGKAVLKT